MRWRKGGNNFGIRQNQFINNYIWDQLADKVATIHYRKSLLLLHAVSARLEFEDQSSFVKFFIKPWAEFIEHRHCGPDDLPA